LGLISGGLDDAGEHLVSSKDKTGKKVYTVHLKRFFAAAAALLILAAGIWLYAVSGKKNSSVTARVPKKSEIVTKNASKTNLVLPDGTKVWLNGGSKLSYDDTYGRKLREVILVGEAFFDVTKNPEKPFIIHTRKMDIRVLGTAFNVMCYPDEKKVETSLLRGSIEVTLKDRPTEKIYLKPNEKLTLIDDKVVNSPGNNSRKIIPGTASAEPMIAISHITYQAKDSSVIETSWLQNKLIFESETFEEVAKKMEKWYDVSIQFSDESVKNLHFTGTFEKETVSEALSAMQITTPFHYSISKKRLIIISK